jgi:hypothetical protein
MKATRFLLETLRLVSNIFKSTASTNFEEKRAEPTQCSFITALPEIVDELSCLRQNSKYFTTGRP